MESCLPSRLLACLLAVSAAALLCSGCLLFSYHQRGPGYSAHMRLGDEHDDPNTQAPNPARQPGPEESEPAEVFDLVVTDLAALVVETVPADARVAIYPPGIDSQATTVSSQIAMELETEAALAAQNRARIITRSQLSVVLEEQNLQIGDLTHPDTQVQVGQLLGATHIVTGSLVTVQRGGVYRWTLQVIDLTDGTVLGGTRQAVRLDSRDIERFSRRRPRGDGVPGVRERADRAERRLRWRAPLGSSPDVLEPWEAPAGVDNDERVWSRDHDRGHPQDPGSRLQGVWQIDYNRAPRDVRQDLQATYGSVRIAFSGRRMVVYMPYAGERLSGTYTVVHHPRGGPGLHVTYADGTEEFAFFRVVDDRHFDLFPDGSTWLPFHRVE